MQTRPQDENATGQAQSGVMARTRMLPRLSDFPIPHGCAVVGTGWAPIMTDVAEHIGARAALMLCELFGGQSIYVPLDPSRSPFANVIGAQKAAIMAHVYGAERLAIPVMKGAIHRAKRQGVLASVRAKKISLREASIVLNTPLRHVSSLINKRGEGVDVEPVDMPKPRILVLLETAAEIAGDALEAAGVPTHSICAMKSEIVDLCG